MLTHHYDNYSAKHQGIVCPSTTAEITRIINTVSMNVAHPNAAPAFLCLPDLVNGMPILRESLDFAAEIPSARFQEKPPRLTILISSSLFYSLQFIFPLRQNSR